MIPRSLSRIQSVIFVATVKKWQINIESCSQMFLVSQRTFSSQDISTIGDVASRWKQRFEKEGVPEPAESINHIIGHVLANKKIADVKKLANTTLDSQQLKKIETLCERRLSRMPIPYIIGEWEFKDIKLKVRPPVFIPRPETKSFVDLVVKRLRPRSDPCHILEIGSGSGAISLSLAHAFKEVHIVAIDINIHASELTLENAKNLNLANRVTVANAMLQENSEIKVDSILHKTRDVDFKNEKFDFIVSNPPYTLPEQINGMGPEVKLYEDLRALESGQDGLKIIIPLLHYAARAIKVGGQLFLEVNTNHPEFIKSFTAKHTDLKLKFDHTFKDFEDKDRIVELTKI